MKAEEEQRSPQPPENIKNNVDHTLGVFRFIGQIVEIYLPRFSDMIITMIGGNASETPAKTDVDRRETPHDLPPGHLRGPGNEPPASGRG